ncbi:MAG: hypothetical protein ACO1SV_25355 [Fimbriimonas sp.]
MRAKADWRHALGAAALLILFLLVVFRATAGRDPSMPTEPAPAGENPSHRASDEPMVPPQ